jgi:hypothetical protein
MTQQETTAGSRHWAPTTVGALAVVTALAATIMTVAHLDITIPGLMDGVDVPVFVPGGFAIATIAAIVVAIGAFRVATWGWWTGLVVFGLAVLVIAGSPARNWLSYLILTVSIIAIGVLVSRPGREGFGRT